MRVRMILAFVVLAVTSLVAQTFRGGILGTVTDKSGAAVADAQVTVSSPDTGLGRSMQTDSAGNYRFSELPLGNYAVTVTKTGFGTETKKGIAVAVSADSRVDFQMSPGRVTEVVEVTGEVPLVDTTSDTVGGTIEGPVAQELPVNGRDFSKLLTLVPGSTSDPGNVSESPGSFGLFSINGNRGRANNYLLDGTDMNDGFRNDPAINEGGVFGVPATLLPVEAVAEFGILSGTEAEYGRNSGAIVNIVTKSGTNSVHGSAFEDFRNNHLDARNYFNCANNPCALNTSPERANIFLNNQFGGSLGGPIVKDKTFYFVAYEGQREKVDFPSVITVPTQTQINNFVAGGGTINPVISNLLALNPWTKPNPLPVGDAAGDSVNLASVLEGTNRLDSVITKIDQHVGARDVFTGRYFFGDSNQLFPLGLASGSNVPGYNTHTPTRVQVVSLSYTHVFTDKLLMEVRGGWNRFAETFTPQDSNFNPNSIGLDTDPSGNPLLFGLPVISVSDPVLGNFNSLGNGNSQPRGRVDTNWQYFTNVSYNTGKHNWKMGFEFRRTSINGFLDGHFRGALSFASLSDFLTGTVDGASQATGDTHRLTHQNNQGLYIQDNYRLTHKLTLNYGLRWDHYGVITEKHNRFSILNTTTDSLQLVGTPGLGQLYPDDWKNFSPRASFAYDMFGTAKTTLRAGWGIYYDAYSQDFFLDQSVNNAGNLGPAYNGIGPSPVSTGSLVGTPLAAGAPVFGNFTPTAPIFTVDQKLRTPYVENYNLNLEQQIGNGVALTVGYVGSQGHRLFRFRDINQFDPSIGGNPFTNPPIIPAGAVINQFESTAYSNYNSLQASLNFRSFHGLTSGVNYTYSHSIDNASDGSDFVPQAAQPDNSRNPNAERGNSNFDVRQRFSWNFNYKLPGSSWIPKLTSGWALDGVVTLMTGTPVNLITFGAQPSGSDFNGSNEFLDRPDIIGNPLQGQHLPDAYLNLSDLAVPCILDSAGNCIAGTQHFGNARRNAFTGPHYRSLDLALSKTTPLGERVRMEIRGDFFNILNHPNFSNPVLPNFFIDFLQNGLTTTQIAAGQFIGTGTGFLPITATPDVGSANPFLGGGGPRNIQLSVRFSF